VTVSAVLLTLLLACVKPLGLYMARVLETAGLERRLYRVCGVDPQAEMDWKQTFPGTPVSGMPASAGARDER
jgi:K+-transporting ATPase A subunit